ncbi:MAG: type II toxin-antitoxin system VapC family toxin [Endomicrobium sp.]|jgi:predicted nucleic acid-binding protein|nr:type II toxin-antitoxin system VapC family toxin [Endomicrobium sp.]
MITTLDVSAAIQILFQKEKSKKFQEIIEKSLLITAPDLYICELSNVLWKYHKANMLTQEECIEYIEDGINFIDVFVDSKQIWQEAFQEGVKNNHSIYDMYYVIITRNNNGILLTNDNDILNICEKLSIESY